MYVYFQISELFTSNAPGVLHAVMNSLGTVAFSNDIKLPVKSLQLTQILGLKYSKEFILDLADFTPD